MPSKTLGAHDDDTTCRFIAQGDANPSVDAPISPHQVRGTFLFGVPGLGWVRQWLDQHDRVVILIAGAAIVGWGAWATFRRPRLVVTRVHRRTDTNPPERDAEIDFAQGEQLLLRDENVTRERAARTGDRVAESSSPAVTPRDEDQE